MYLTSLIVCLTIVSANALKSWDYTLVSLDIQINVDFVHADVKNEKVKRGEYALNGHFELDKDLGPDCMAKTFRSPRGNDDYKPMPFAMPKQKFSEFFNGVYKKVVMEDLHKCSPDTPYFEDQWEGVLKAGTFQLNMCKFNVDNWPDNMPPGFYKLLIEFFHDTDTENPMTISTVIVQIESTMGMG